MGGSPSGPEHTWAHSDFTELFAKATRKWHPDANEYNDFHLDAWRRLRTVYSSVQYAIAAFSQRKISLREADLNAFAPSFGFPAEGQRGERAEIRGSEKSLSAAKSTERADSDCAPARVPDGDPSFTVGEARLRRAIRGLFSLYADGLCTPFEERKVGWMLSVHKDGSALLHAFMLLGEYPAGLSNAQWTEGMFKEAGAREALQWQRCASESPTQKAQGFSRLGAIYARACAHVSELKAANASAREADLPPLYTSRKTWDKLIKRQAAICTAR